MVTKASILQICSRVQEREKNVAADSLSRRDEMNPPSLFNITAVESDWIIKALKMGIGLQRYSSTVVKGQFSQGKR